MLGKAEQGQVLSKQDKEMLNAIEAEIQALKVQQETLPKEVRRKGREMMMIDADNDLRGHQHAYIQLEEARSRQEEMRRVLEGKKQALDDITAKEGEHINNLTRGVQMYKHLGLDFERKSSWLS